jgi:Ala-tRNA(Pro) deacylase
MAPSSPPHSNTPLTRAQLFERLATLEIATKTVEHPPAHTVAESSAIDIGLPGAHTKNLFVKDEDGTLLLVVAKSSTKVDLKTVARKLGTGRLSFAKPDVLQEVLGVSPGSVTAFAIANDVKRRVRLILDHELSGEESVNCHPLENTATTNIALEDLLRFIRASNHEPKIMIVSGT